MTEKSRGPSANGPHARLALRRRRSGLNRSFFISLAALAVVFALGTAGYRYLEGWSLVDSLYMVLITLATIGYGEVHSLSEAGRWFTIALIVVGLGNFALIIGSYSQALADGRLLRASRRRRLDKRLARLSGHCILCGYGRVGEVVAAEIVMDGGDLVIIDSDENRAEALEDFGCPYIVGDATSDEVLRHAGIERAAALVTSMANDAENIYVVLSARHMNPRVRIVSRAGGDARVDKLRKAGADEVLLPHLIGGRRMALAARRPSTTFFIESARRGGDGYLLEEARLAGDSPLAGKSLAEAGLWSRSDVLVAGVRRGGGAVRLGLRPDFVFAPGDVVLIVGAGDAARELAEKVRGNAENA